MNALFATPNTLLGTLNPQSRAGHLLTGLVITVLGTILMTISAKVQIPFIAVPATFQGMTVAILAAAFGWRIGVATIALYIVEGLAGLPVFASGGGAGYIMSPTFGFIIGWLPMAYIIGKAADAGLSKMILPLFAVMVVGDAVSFVFGYVWLAMLASGAGWIDQTNVLGSAFNIAVKPFIVWDLLKMAFAAVTIAAGWQFISSRKSS